MLWRIASMQMQKTTQLISRVGETETNQEKNKRKEKKYKNGEKSEWTPEITNVSFTGSNPGLHLSMIGQTVNVAYIYKNIVCLFFVNVKQTTKLVRFDNQLLTRAVSFPDVLPMNICRAATGGSGGGWFMNKASSNIKQRWASEQTRSWRDTPTLERSPVIGV